MDWKENLSLIRRQNNDFAWRMSSFLNNTPDAITQQLMEECNPGHVLSNQRLHFVLLSSFLGYDPDVNEEDAFAENTYLSKSTQLLDVESFRQNPYLKNIQIPSKIEGNWQFDQQTYQPFELFVRDDIIVSHSTREIPLVGYFETPYSFPLVKENGREWMAIKPSEIATMQEPIEEVKGRVVVFGLGLGYFPYMISLKEDVNSILIVEKEKSAIQLFKKYLYPQFENASKIQIVEQDAFVYLKEQLPKEQFDYAFVDLWHDVSDGLHIYLKIRRMEKYFPQMKFLYWVERSLLSAYRWQCFDDILQHSKTEEEALKNLSDESIKNRIC